MSPADPAIDVRGLRKHYGPIRAVDGVDLTIAPGQVYALLGPNGAGKTTTVEILEGFRRRDEGEARVLGMDPGAGSLAYRARIGIAFQNSATQELLSPREILRFQAALYPDPMPPEGALALAGLTEAADRRAGKLSGGQRRRLDLAAAVVGRPELIFLDEPTTGFDPAARRQAWEVVRGLTSQGRTVLLTTHYLDEAEALADRIGIIARGRIIAEGTMDELRRHFGARTRIRWRHDAAHAAGGVAAGRVGRRSVAGGDGPSHALDGGAVPRPARAARLGRRRRPGRPARVDRHAVDAGGVVPGTRRGGRPGGGGAVVTAAPGGPRHTLRIGGLMAVLVLKTTVREPAALFFLILFPLLMLVVFGSIFDFEMEGTDVKLRQYFVAGIIASSVFGTAFLNLSIGIAAQQHEGSLRQLAAAPLPKASFFIGQIGAATIITVAQIIVMLIVGILAFGVPLPDAGGWLTLAWIVPLGVAAGCTMGIAITAIIPSARAAPAITNAPYITLQFISGVFFPFHSLPESMQWIATVFPIRWMAQGLRSVFLPDDFRYQEVNQSWELEWVAIVLGWIVAGLLFIWIVAGLLFTMRTFRWDRSGG